jgi:hypothetical protein
LPEGKPYFEVQVSEMLSRQGIDEDAAVEDFNQGVDAEVPGELYYRYGHVAVYGYQVRVITGRIDLVIVRAWVRER